MPEISPAQARRRLLHRLVPKTNLINVEDEQQDLTGAPAKRPLLIQMGFPDQVLTKGKSGKLELRALHSRGSFVRCKYLSPETLKLADRKTKLTLKNEDGTVEEYFIIPLKDARRSLLVKAEAEEKDRKIWNEKTQREEDL